MYYSFVLLQIVSSLDLATDSKRRWSRPQWATHSAVHFSSNDPEHRMSSAQWNAGIRPGPVRNPVPRLTEKSLRASLRSHGSTKSECFYTDIHISVRSSYEGLQLRHLGTGHFIRNTWPEAGWALFDLQDCLILHCIDSPRSSKHSSESLVHINMIASCSHFRFVSCTSVTKISH